MARVTIEDCLTNLDSRFSLVHLAVRRVLQLRSGAPPLVNAPKNKEVVVALREIAANKVTPDNIRTLEETRRLPEAPSLAKDDSTRAEVKDILDEMTHFEPTLEYEQQEQISEPEDEE